jgi:hypothetical protein
MLSSSCRMADGLIPIVHKALGYLAGKLVAICHVAI